MMDAASLTPSPHSVIIRTPDQRLRVFVSSTLKELADERQAVRQAVANLRLAPVMFESGARPHPAQELYTAYLSQSHIFIGIYWRSYGWVAPGMQVSGLEDEYDRAAHKPGLIYIKMPAEGREPALTKLLERIKRENVASYKYFSTTEQLGELVENDLMLLLTEYFETAAGKGRIAVEQPPVPAAHVPVPRSPLIGRERELAAARDMLLGRDAALLTLTGAAGAGKSRLGIQVALDLHDQFPDGSYLVRLSPLQDAGLVLPAIAKTLGLKEGAEKQPLPEVLRAYLADKRLLLLLDNFEHVLRAAPQIAALLEASPQVKTVVTSRAPLRIRPERELPVQPLALPPRGMLELEQLSQSAAVQLFVERAQSVNMDFRLTAENAAAVAEICRRLDGLPLAIELAAARVRLLSPQALLARLGGRFDMLRADTRDLPRRQQTLYEAIDWSYNLLSEEDKRLLQCLSMFVGGWTFESAEAICAAGEDAAINIYDGLERLMNNNLLKPLENGGGEPRMRQFETIREFANEHLQRSGQADAAYERYREYFLQLAEHADTGLHQSARQGWYERIDAELDNLRAVMRSALRVGEKEKQLRIATALWRFWWVHGYWSEALQWLKTGLEAANGIPVALRARALTQSGWLCRYMGEISQSVAALEQGLALWRQTDDRHGLAMALSNLGASVLRQGEAQRATALAQEALELVQGSDDRLATFFALEVLGHVASRQGETRRAIEIYTEAVALAEQADDDAHLATLLNALGDDYTTAGEYERAEECFSRAAVICKRLGNRIVGAYLSGNRGMIALKKGNCRQAFELLCDALLVLQELGDKENAILCLEAFAYIGRQCHAPDRAVRLLAASEALLKEKRFIRPQPMQGDFEAMVEELRAELGATQYDAAWSAGSRMSYSQAISYAVDKAWLPSE